MLGVNYWFTRVQLFLSWDGMGWDGMGWDGMGWDEMGWDGMGFKKWARMVPTGRVKNRFIDHHSSKKL